LATQSKTEATAWAMEAMKAVAMQAKNPLKAEATAATAAPTPVQR
jgi:hypothetical protein